MKAEQAKYEKVFQTFQAMSLSGDKAEAMTTEELCTALAELKLEGGEHIASLESAVKGEALHRLRHPFRSWLKHFWDRIDSGRNV